MNSTFIYTVQRISYTKVIQSALQGKAVAFSEILKSACKKLKVSLWLALTYCPFRDLTGTSGLKKQKICEYAGNYKLLSRLLFDIF